MRHFFVCCLSLSPHSPSLSHYLTTLTIIIWHTVGKRANENQGPKSNVRAGCETRTTHVRKRRKMVKKRREKKCDWKQNSSEHHQTEIILIIAYGFFSPFDSILDSSEYFPVFFRSPYLPLSTHSCFLYLGFRFHSKTRAQTHKSTFSVIVGRASKRSRSRRKIPKFAQKTTAENGIRSTNRIHINIHIYVYAKRNDSKRNGQREAANDLTARRRQNIYIWKSARRRHFDRLIHAACVPSAAYGVSFIMSRVSSVEFPRLPVVNVCVCARKCDIKCLSFSILSYFFHFSVRMLSGSLVPRLRRCGWQRILNGISSLYLPRPPFQAQFFPHLLLHTFRLITFWHQKIKYQKTGVGGKQNKKYWAIRWPWPLRQN